MSTNTEKKIPQPPPTHIDGAPIHYYRVRCTRAQLVRMPERVVLLPPHYYRVADLRQEKARVLDPYVVFAVEEPVATLAFVQVSAEAALVTCVLRSRRDAFSKQEGRERAARRLARADRKNAAGTSYLDLRRNEHALLVPREELEALLHELGQGRKRRWTYAEARRRLSREFLFRARDTDLDAK